MRSFTQGGASTRQDAGGKSPHRNLASSKAPSALGAPPKRLSPVRALGDSPVRTQASEAGSSNRQAVQVFRLMLTCDVIRSCC